MRKKISVVGIGANGRSGVTVECAELIKEASYLVGAKRMVESVISFNQELDCDYLIDGESIVKAVVDNATDNVVVVMSGDTGFHSGAAKLYELLVDNNVLESYDVEIYAGVSSLQYMASKIKRPWQDVFLTSAHGVECNFIGHLLCNRECFFLVGGKITAKSLINSLFEANFTDLIVYVGENLGYHDEKITVIDKLDKEIDFEISSLAVVWVVRESLYIDSYVGMIDDDDFIRGKVPITKSSVRNHSVSLVGRNQSGLVFYDIGAGTGSIAVELALSNPNSIVYAFEVNPVAVDLIKENRLKFGAYNLILIEGNAPNSLENIPNPDKVFIGGSKGNMMEIFDVILEKNPACFITVSAIAVETFAKTVEIFKEKNIANFNVTQLAVSNTKTVGDYNMLIAQNPTFLIYGGG